MSTRNVRRSRRVSGKISCGQSKGVSACHSRKQSIILDSETGIPTIFTSGKTLRESYLEGR